ncbi:hypothetical protein B0T21DRAFT_123811 [Apiosordaria backusii]|uniref:Uncharacterized protein n=1 Tax=Apiosordaria backusii TaxID=314023 RepID=A0AA40K123_9PEZI|nr:hypothetical protein B0T21DRAFT_123811 [Apiosordaria backusii]
MDALAAIALSGNILQFVEFAIKLLRSSGELYSKGDLTRNATIQESISRIREIANEKMNQCNEFEHKFRLAFAGEPLPEEVRRNDALILDLCSRCLEIAQSLQDVLERLKLPSNSPSRGWQSLLTALRTVLSEREIESHVARLTEIKSTLASTILSSLS